MSKEAVGNVSYPVAPGTTGIAEALAAGTRAVEAAISRMAYLFAAVQDTDAFVAQVRALQPAAG